MNEEIDRMQDKIDEEIIYPLSDYQMLYIFSLACAFRIEKAAFTSKGKLIIDYEAYGKKCRESIPRDRPTPTGIHAMSMANEFYEPFDPMEGFNISKKDEK